MGAFFMEKRVKYRLKQKLSVVLAIKSGRESCVSVLKKMGCNFTTIRRWIKLYREHGKAGLSLRQGTYDDKFKLQVVKHLLKKSLCLKKTAVILDILHEGIVSKWLQKCLNLGLRPKGNAGLNSYSNG